MKNERLAEQIENNFKHHAPMVDERSRIAAINHYAKELAEMINELCPDSREKSLAVTHTEEAVMWAEKAIERNQPEQV